ncbi:hypothetical protein J4219_00925 [Candidatus Woesearchaeota archaeon]|nr:hypothetical protein [Candidatus Woesearchaeota archaeon]
MNIEAIKFVLGLGAGGILAFAATYFATQGSILAVLLFGFLCLLFSWFMPGATASACVIYAIFAFISAVDAQAGRASWGVLATLTVLLVLTLIAGVWGGTKDSSLGNSFC